MVWLTEGSFECMHWYTASSDTFTPVIIMVLTILLLAGAYVKDPAGSETMLLVYGFPFFVQDMEILLSPNAVHDNSTLPPVLLYIEFASPYTLADWIPEVM